MHETSTITLNKKWYRTFLNCLSIPLAFLLWVFGWKKQILRAHLHLIRKSADAWSLLRFYHSLSFEIWTFLFGRLSGTLEVPPPSWEALQKARASGALVLCAHFGNFEMMGFALRSLGLPMQAIALPLKSGFWNRVLSKLRSRHGDYTFPLAGNLNKAFDILRSSESLAFLSDQESRMRFSSVHFCGKSFQASALPETLVRRTGCQVFQSLMFRQTNGNYQLFFQQIQNYSHDYFRNLEAIIQKHPEQWFNGTHRIFSCTNSEMYSL